MSQIIDLGKVVGDKGETGVGISDVKLNGDYTLTITTTDGKEYTTTSIRGPQGETGPRGEKGAKGDSIELTDTLSSINTLAATPKLVSGALGRTNSVTSHSTMYETNMVRGEALYEEATSSRTPTLNGTIGWYYE